MLFVNSLPSWRPPCDSMSVEKPLEGSCGHWVFIWLGPALGPQEAEAVVLVPRLIMLATGKLASITHTLELCFPLALSELWACGECAATGRDGTTMIQLCLKAAGQTLLAKMSRSPPIRGSHYRWKSSWRAWGKLQTHTASFKGRKSKLKTEADKNQDHTWFGAALAERNLKVVISGEASSLFFLIFL